jgi:hypothetical protein
MQTANSIKFPLSLALLSCYASIANGASQEKIAYVKQKYEHVFAQKEYLFYPAKNPKSLVIVFTSAVKNKYEMWSWFWKDTEDWQDEAYLFLKDDDFCWYLGNDKQSFVEAYKNIINQHIALTKVPKDHVFTIGGSMGGYAAIFYAATLGLGGTVAYNPQVNKASNSRTLRYALENTGNRWQDLDTVLASCEKLPMLALTFGDFSKDLFAAYTIIDLFKIKKSLIILRHVALPGHKGLQYCGQFFEILK